MTSPKPRRRFLQFSLRTLFVLMTVFAVWFGWKMQKAREQAKAVAWVREMGGTVGYEYGNGASEPSSPGWLRDILGIDFMYKVVSIELDNTEVVDLTPLTRLKNVHMVSLISTSVNDLTPLTQMKKLQWLYLDATPVSDLTALARCEHLLVLSLIGTQVSDVTSLAKAKNLQWLFLDYSLVTDLRPLTGSKNLQVLSLNSAPITDVTPLAGLKNLHSLYLYGTPVTQDELDELQAALPNCEIEWSPSDK